MDTAKPNQHLLIDKLTPRFDDYSRGDIIVFHPPDTSREVTSHTSSASSAWVATTSRYMNGAVWVNGAKLDEPYV